MNSNLKINSFLLLILLITSLTVSLGGNYTVIMSDTHMKFVSPELVSAYQQSVINASNPTREKIYKKLFSIHESNNQILWKTIQGEEHLLVARFIEDKGGNSIPIDQKDIWGTIFPQLYEFCSNYMAKHPQAKLPDLGLRISQLLGLPADRVGFKVVEFWVKPSDIFRPCPDVEITDEQCDINIPENITSEHSFWFNRLRAISYADGYKNLEYGGYPWTQLGYSYDWSPESKDHVGLSEYVVRKGSKIYIQSINSIDEYCKRRSVASIAINLRYVRKT